MIKLTNILFFLSINIGYAIYNLFYYVHRAVSFQINIIDFYKKYKIYLLTLIFSFDTLESISFSVNKIFIYFQLFLN